MVCGPANCPHGFIVKNKEKEKKKSDIDYNNRILQGKFD
jgi:hypothetical protein